MAPDDTAARNRLSLSHICPPPVAELRRSDFETHDLELDIKPMRRHLHSELLVHFVLRDTLWQVNNHYIFA
jgi:hypothetical protein